MLSMIVMVSVMVTVMVMVLDILMVMLILLMMVMLTDKVEWENLRGIHLLPALIVQIVCIRELQICYEDSDFQVFSRRGCDAVLDSAEPSSS